MVISGVNIWKQYHVSGYEFSIFSGPNIFLLFFKNYTKIVLNKFFPRKTVQCYDSGFCVVHTRAGHQVRLRYSSVRCEFSPILESYHRYIVLPLAKDPTRKMRIFRFSLALFDKQSICRIQYSSYRCHNHSFHYSYLLFF